MYYTDKSQQKKDKAILNLNSHVHELGHPLHVITRQAAALGVDDVDPTLQSEQCKKNSIYLINL